MTVSTPEPDPTPETPEPDKGEESGFAVYDTTLQRYVGAVHKTKGEATKAANKVEGHEYETRKV